MNWLKNAFIKRFLKHLLDGNKGSNLLVLIVTPLLGANINYMLAYHGLEFKESAAVLELAKVVGIVLLAVVGYFIGKYPKVAKVLGFLEDAIHAGQDATNDVMTQDALERANRQP